VRSPATPEALTIIRFKMMVPMVNDNHPYWPGEKQFALCLTHDVDRVDKRWWQCAYYFLRNRDPYQLKSLVTKKKERPFWNFERIMDIERERGVRSTFFFLNETKKANLLKPSSYALSFGYYDIDEPAIVDVIKALDTGGWEIGVHGSYDSYLNRELLIKEKEALERIVGRPVRGVRQHFLNLRVPETWKLQAEAGFKYDSSFGFRDRVDFRDSKIRPFHPLDNDFLVIPMVVMDGPLFQHSERIEDAWTKCASMIRQAEEQGAVLTILWHNNRFNDQEFPGQAGVYKRIIQECQDRGAWVATAGEVYQWCTSQS
jgi:peptidoglycan/xylan/chitin deacetylase (PgdA/CDA1 family)